MKTWIAVVSLAFGLLVMHGEAHAMRCTTHTITQGGRMVTCTTCCTQFGCNTNCYVSRRP